MNFINEYALLFAVALPVIVIVAIQVALFVAGERATLLLPGLGAYPSIELSMESLVAQPTGLPPQYCAAVGRESSNDEAELEAA